MPTGKKLLAAAAHTRGQADFFAEAVGRAVERLERAKEAVKAAERSLEEARHQAEESEAEAQAAEAAADGLGSFVFPSAAQIGVE